VRGGTEVPPWILSFVLQFENEFFSMKLKYGFPRGEFIRPAYISSAAWLRSLEKNLQFDRWISGFPHFKVTVVSLIFAKPRTFGNLQFNPNYTF